MRIDDPGTPVLVEGHPGEWQTQWSEYAQGCVVCGLFDGTMVQVEKYDERGNRTDGLFPRSLVTIDLKRVRAGGQT